MKKILLTLFTATVLAQFAQAQENEQIALQNEMTAADIQLASLLSTTQDELKQTMQAVGGEQILEDSRTRSKIAYRAELIITYGTNPIVKVEFKNGERFLSAQAAQDVGDASIAYYNQVGDPSVAGKIAGQKFDVAIKCIEIAGQGLEAITLCGFFTGFIK